jgi:hypothetical protein
MSTLKRYQVFLDYAISWPCFRKVFQNPNYVVNLPFPHSSTFYKPSRRPAAGLNTSLKQTTENPNRHLQQVLILHACSYHQSNIPVAANANVQRTVSFDRFD